MKERRDESIGHLEGYRLPSAPTEKDVMRSGVLSYTVRHFGPDNTKCLVALKSKE